MAIVLDTSILIDLLRGHADARYAMRIAAGSGELVVASVVSIVEVLAGMRPSEEQATRSLLGSLSWIGVDEALAEHAGQLANRYARAYPGVDPVDYIIAATAEQLSAPLWTHNLKHFPMFPALTVPY